jgi:hypothetical protein
MVYIGLTFRAGTGTASGARAKAVAPGWDPPSDNGDQTNMARYHSIRGTTFAPPPGSIMASDATERPITPEVLERAAELYDQLRELGKNKAAAALHGSSIKALGPPKKLMRSFTIPGGRASYWKVTREFADVAPQAFLTERSHCPGAVPLGRVALI